MKDKKKGYFLEYMVAGVIAAIGVIVGNHAGFREGRDKQAELDKDALDLMSDQLKFFTDREKEE